MPETVIPALDWAYDQDLDDVVAAAGFRCTYRNPGAGHVWNPAIFDGLRVYRGEASPDTVRIEGETDGFADTVILGIVDRSRREDRGDGTPRGALIGRDLLALVLDRYPSTAFTLDGLNVTAVPGAPAEIRLRDTFTSAVQRVCDAAGISVLFVLGGRDYPLGRSIAVTTDRTFAQVLADLMEPFRWSEKYRVDAWMDGTRLVIARRGEEARGRVTTEAARIVEIIFEKTALPIVNDVRVEGARYDVPVREDQEDRSAFRGYQVDIAGPTPESSYRETTTEFVNRRGQLDRMVRYREYADGQRRERWDVQATFINQAGSPLDGNKASESEHHYVADNRSGLNTSFPFEKLVGSKLTVWRYYEDNGDTQSEDTIETERDETAESETVLPPKTCRITSYRYLRSHRQTLRYWNVSEVDASTGEIERSTFGASEIAPFRMRRGEGDRAASVSTEPYQIAAGPNTAQRRESSDLLGSEAACEALRQDLLDEHSCVRIGVSVAMAPDLRLRVGMVQVVQGAPADWPVTEWLITAIRADATDRRFGMRVEGIAWQSAP